MVRHILDYLINHPDAGDTIDHIIDWWLPPQKSRPVQKARAALDYLVRCGIVREVFLPGEKRLYKAALRKQSMIRELACCQALSVVVAMARRNKRV